MAIDTFEWAGAMEGDILPDGRAVANFWSSNELQTAPIALAVQPPQKVRYPRLSEDGGSIVGQGQESGPLEGTWLYAGGKWKNEGICSGVSPAIFDASGVLWIIRPGPDQTSQGYRCLDAGGLPLLGDETMVIRLEGRLLHEYTPILLPDTSVLYIGQDHDSGCHIVYHGVRRVLADGPAYVIRARLVAERLAICVSWFERQSVQFWWMDLADVETLPTFSTGPSRSISPSVSPSRSASASASHSRSASASPSPSNGGEDMALISDDAFKAMCDEVATVLGSPIPGSRPPVSFVPGVSHQELWQGCIQMGDKFRKPKAQGGLYERNPSATELSMGSYMRDGSTHLDDPKVQALHELLAPIDSRYLRR